MGGHVLPACPPTLAKSRATKLCTDGKSAAGLLDAPETVRNGVAFSQIPRGALVNGMSGNEPQENYMGYSVRTPSWRYTEWRKFDNNTGTADWSTLYGQELYAEVLGGQCLFDQDHTNVASDPANAAVIDEHSAMLRSLPQLIV